VIYHGKGNCATCHSVDGSALVGPSLHLIGSSGEGRIAGLDAAAYIRVVIEDPSRTNPSLMPGIMPWTYKQLLTPAEIDDLVAYLMTMR
jgi:mono/diheme cytochrome c family protein